MTKNTRAVVCVHLAGWPCDIDDIRAATGPDVKLIEDCAQAHGARYKGRSVGGIGDIGAWSFCQDKIMTTGGEGGMLTCNDETLWRKMWAFKDHGKSYKAVYERDHPLGFRWLHENFGTNWRMTEIQAVLGLIQLDRMPSWHANRTANATALTKALKPFAGISGPVRLTQPPCSDCTCDTSEEHCVHAAYKYYTFVRPENLASGWTRDRIITEITNLGVPCLQGSCSEIYLEKAFDGTDLRPKRSLPIAKELGATSLMFLIHPTLTTDNIAQTCSAITKVLSAASRA